MSKKSLGLLIRKLRKEKGLSFRKLADRLKEIDDKNAVSYVNIVHIENGRIETKRDVLVLLAKTLDYNEDALLAEGDKLGSDVEEIINKKSDVVPAFLRSTKNLTNEDWDELSKVVQKMNKKND